MTTLRAFLDSRRVAKDDIWNLTGMTSKIDVGKYCVSNNDYDELLRLHHDHVFVNGLPSSLLEKHGDYTPILIDLDFRYTASNNDREYTKEDVRIFVKAYADAFFQFIDHTDSIRFFVEMKPNPVTEKDVKKDGIHIICPDITVDYSIPFTLRKYLLEHNVLACFPGFTNSADDCFDESVIKRNNWFLHGATKPDKAQYSVAYCFIADPDGGFDETEWDESDLDMTYMFSLHHNRNTPTSLTIRSTMIDEWNTWKDFDRKKPNTKPNTNSDTLVVHGPLWDDAASVSSNVSAGISKIMKFNECIWNVIEQADGYKLSHNSKACLVETGYMHSDLNHSCIYVQRSHATMTCLSHKSKRISKACGNKLWHLLTGEEENDWTAAYNQRKITFEESNFRVLDPPGYMVLVGGKWIHYNRQQLMDMNSGIFLDEEKKVRFVDEWLRDESIKTYDRIGYYVDRAECPPSIFNTFAGFAADSIVSRYIVDIARILQHVKLLCNHNNDAYEFVLDWFASVVQSPGTLNGICVIFKGKHGCGKDMFLSWFGSRVIGIQNYYKTARPHIDLFGAFNSSRKDIVFYHIEEGNDAVFKDTNLQQFKNYITDSYASIQIKQKNTTASDSLVKNYNHFAISTNNVISCEINERRFFGIEASAEMCKNQAYFSALAETMANPDVVASFYAMLKQRDISSRNWCDMPQTDYMKEMISASVPELYYFLDGFLEAYVDETIVVKASEFYDAYRDWHTQYGTEKLKTSTSFGRDIKNIKGINKTLDRDGTFYTIDKNCKEFVKSIV